MQTLECLIMIKRLDRYCWKSLQDALLSRMEDSTEKSSSMSLTRRDVWELASRTAVELRAIRFELHSIKLTRMFLPETNRHHYCRVNNLCFSCFVPFVHGLRLYR